MIKHKLMAGCSMAWHAMAYCPTLLGKEGRGWEEWRAGGEGGGEGKKMIPQSHPAYPAVSPLLTPIQGESKNCPGYTGLLDG